MEKNYVFIKKVHTKTHRLSKKKDGLVVFVFQETNNYSLFDKNRTQENI